MHSLRANWMISLYRLILILSTQPAGVIIFAYSGRPRFLMIYLSQRRADEASETERRRRTETATGSSIRSERSSLSRSQSTFE